MNKNKFLTYSRFTIVILTGADANRSTEASIQCSLPTTDSDGDDTGGDDSRAVFYGVGGEADRGNPKLSCCGRGDTTECSSP